MISSINSEFNNLNDNTEKQINLQMTEQLQTEIDEFKKENMKTKIKCEIMLFNIFNCIFFTEKQIQNFDKRHQKSLFFKISLIILSEFDRESHNKH